LNQLIALILVALLQYLFFAGRVGFNRVKYNVPAPKTVGNEIWERMYRVQMNTLEQLIVFIPALLAFGHFVSNAWALLPGGLFLLGRQLYSHLYIKNPESRGPGMIMSFLSNIVLVLGSFIGLLLQII
jgi:glutathione S-transferase